MSYSEKEYVFVKKHFYEGRIHKIAVTTDRKEVMASKYELIYFPLGGRALACRLMFKVAGVEFTDTHIPFSEWEQQKSDEKRFPLGQMPVLIVNGEVICQSQAMYRYLGNEFGFYGENNLEKARIDQVVETLNENFTDIVKIMFDKALSDEEKGKKYEEMFASEAVKKRMSLIQDIKKKYGSDGFVGKKISTADFIFYAQHDMVKGNSNFPKYLEQYPDLQKVIDWVDSCTKK